MIEAVSTDIAPAVALFPRALPSPVPSPLRGGTVPRIHLLRRLVAARDVPVVLLTAHAGYGKTTLATEWAHRDERPFAWFSCADEGAARRARRALDEAQRSARPQVIVVDDAQRADAATTSALLNEARRLAVRDHAGAAVAHRSRRADGPSARAPPGAGAHLAGPGDEPAGGRDALRRGGREAHRRAGRPAARVHAGLARRALPRRDGGRRAARRRGRGRALRRRRPGGRRLLQRRVARRRSTRTTRPSCAAPHCCASSAARCATRCSTCAARPPA